MNATPRYTLATLIIMVAALATILYAATLQVGLKTGGLIGLVLLGVLFHAYVISYHVRDKKITLALRLLIIGIATFLAWRYLYWRATETLPMAFGFLSAVFGLALFLAEFYGFVTTLFGFFSNISPLEREPLALPADQNLWPHVDVYVPTYNEDPAILYPTIIAATQIDYPREKLHVYILDDGGTAQKCNDANPEKARQARTRQAELQALAAKFGAGYLTREKNLHAKAGNVNSALNFTNGALILILDCDHIPTQDFLKNTVGFFLHDPKLFLVQTPHNFINADPLERNLDTFQASPAENELFYDVIQPGLDFWGASFFCGSAAMLRRSVLDEVGGFAGQTITEDAETTLDAMSLGYRTMYFNRPMVSGLQPETYSGFILQRSRWGQGMLQIFMLKNPWLIPNLSLVQRLLYTNFAFYWGFALSRLAMLCSPIVFLFFSANLCDTTNEELMVYALPQMLAALITTQYFYGRVRWPFMSQLYETAQAIFVTWALVAVVRKPRAPTFKVTPKGEDLNESFISELAWPFYIFLSLNLISIAFGVWRYIDEPAHRGMIIFVEFWAVLDALFLLGMLGVLFEQRQPRKEPRVAHQEAIEMRWGESPQQAAAMVNASMSGLQILLPEAALLPPIGTEVQVLFPQRGVACWAGIRWHWHNPQGAHYVGLSYQPASIADERLIAAVAFGSSAQLLRNNQQRHKGKTVIGSLVWLIYTSVFKGGAHLLFIVRRQIIKNLVKPKLGSLG
ncbi:MAG: UDP-forming cellulose synthase catalytic subunit [Sideroxydans sp.]|nr:UDP-forming cellulose synthase catalytic subunit [Sideroxydans sp.]